MQSHRPESARKWIVQMRFGLVPAMVGGVVVAFVATRGADDAWLLWFAVPLLMIGLGYLYVVSALPIFLNEGANHQSDREPREELREK